MIELQQPDAQIRELSESTSFEAEICLGMIELTPGHMTPCNSQQTSYPTPEAAQNKFQETGPLEVPTDTFSPDFQLSEYGIFNATCDPPMSFRDRHRFLDRVYNSYPNPALITAEDMGDIARKVGLLMEEVLSWFKDEKSRRAELLEHTFHQAQKSACKFPPSPESTRCSGEVSATSSSYNATSPGMPLKPQDISSPCSASADQKIQAPRKAKRGRPAKTHVKTELDLPLPDAKRKKVPMMYPCPDCQNFVLAERWAEHINRTHFPKHVWECPKTNRQTGRVCSSSPDYRPAYRGDNFAKHLKDEHDCHHTEVAELKKTCKFKVANFFHKICGFCDERLDSRDESIEHIKDHFRKASEEPNPPVDLGISLWKEKCGIEHKLQLGIHYRRSQASKSDPTDEDGNHDRDEDENGGSGEGNPDNSNHDRSGHGQSDSRSNNNNHDHNADENGASGDGNLENLCHDNSGSQSNNNSHTHDHEDSRWSEDSSDNSGDPRSIDATSSQRQPSIGQPKMDSENAPDLPSISSVLGWCYDGRPECQERDNSSSQATRSPTGIPQIRPRRLTSKEDANFQCHVEGCGKLFGRSYNFKAHLETHDETREHPFPCSVKDCDKSFERKTDLEKHHQSVHVAQRNRCENCGLAFAREDTLRRHIEGGCSKRCDVETSGGASTAEQTYHILSHHMGSGKEEMDFPLYPDPESKFLQGPHQGYPKMRAFLRDTIHPMEFPEFRASSSYSTASGAPCKSSAFDSPHSIRTPQYSLCTQNSTSSDYSTASGPSAVPSSSMGSPHSIHGHIVPPPEWTPRGFGLNPSIVSYDNVGPGNEYTSSVGGMDDFNLDFNLPKPNGFVDLSIIHQQYTGRPTFAAHSNCNSYPYPPPSVTSGQSQSSQADFSSGDHREKGRCTYPDCGKVFQDLKAHMLTHQNERPEKCPIQTCDYHIKGFARKYDKNRHTLTHYKGTMVCGFCPGSGSAAEKSFNRADVFKRHLTSVHAVEQTPPNSRKKTSGNIHSANKLSGYAPDATGKCSTCSEIFGNAQDFYEHLDDCVLRIVQQEEPSEAVNAAQLAEVEKDQSVDQKLRHDASLQLQPPRVTNEDEDDENDDGFKPRSRKNSPNSLQRHRKNSPYSLQRHRGLAHSKGGVTLNSKGRKKRRDHPSWGCPASKMKMKKRVLSVFDGPRRLWKDDMMLDTDYEAPMKLNNEKAYVTDLDIETILEAEACHKSTEVPGLKKCSPPSLSYMRQND